jgi:hypothetical protein
MLTFFIGDDVVKAKAEAQKRARGAEVVRIGEGGEPLESTLSYLEQRGMFQPEVVIIIDRPLDGAEGKEYVLEHGEALNGSKTKVFVIQPEVDALTRKKLEKLGTIEVFDERVRDETTPPSAFALVDAMQVGDRKRAWILYRDLINAGVSAEEVHGTLAWAARGVVLASNTRSADEAGMKPYPYGKAKDVARRLKPGDAVAQSAELVRLYHDARMGRGTLEDLLEIYLLRKV